MAARIEQLTYWHRPRHKVETIWGAMDWRDWLAKEALRFEAAGRRVRIWTTARARHSELALMEEVDGGR